MDNYKGLKQVKERSNMGYSRMGETLKRVQLKAIS